MIDNNVISSNRKDWSDEHVWGKMYAKTGCQEFYSVHAMFQVPVLKVI